MPIDSRSNHRSGSPGFFRSAEKAGRGFTLLEIIIVLSIAAVLIGLSVPFISGMLREDQMRRPVRELQDLAQLMRNRAMTEHLAYEINFTAEGFSGRQHKLYSESLGAGATPRPTPADGSEPDQSSSDEPPAPTEETEKSEVVAEFAFPAEMTCRLLFWGSRQWMEPAGEPATSQWVFQPSGLCNPLRVQFRKGESWIEAAFNPLTADIQEERFNFPQ